MFSVEFRYRARKIYKSVKQIVELVSNVSFIVSALICRLIILMRYTTPIER